MQKLSAMLLWTIDQPFVPGWASFWLKSFGNHPALLLFCSVIALWLFLKKGDQLQTQDFARLAYFPVALLAALPVIDAVQEEWLRPGWSWAMQKLSTIMLWIGSQHFFPGWVSFWLKSFANHPTLFLLCSVIVLWLFFKKSARLQDQIFARAEYAWRNL